jgi:hypothetical protein
MSGIRVNSGVINRLTHSFYITLILLAGLSRLAAQDRVIGVNTNFTFMRVTGFTQGIGCDGTNIYIFETLSVDKFSNNYFTGHFNRKPFDGLGDYNHLGDGEYYAGCLYVPMESWHGCGNTTNVSIGVFSATDDLTRLNVAVVTPYQSEISAVCVVPAFSNAPTIFASDFCDGGHIYQYSLTDSTNIAFVRALPLSQPVSLIQGISSYNGMVYLMSDAGHSGKFWSVNPTNGLTTLLTTLDQPGEIEWEGIDTTQGNLRVGEGGAGKLYFFDFLTTNDVPPAVTNSAPPILTNSIPPTQTNQIPHTATNAVQARVVGLNTNLAYQHYVESRQGIASAGTNLYFFETSAVDKFNDDYSQAQYNRSPFDGLDGYDTLGDGDFYSGRLYVPMESWQGCGDTANASIGIFSAADLTRLKVIVVSDYQAEISAVCVAPSVSNAPAIFAADYCDDNNLYQYSLTDLTNIAFVRTLPLSRPVPLIQGISSYNGMLYLMSGAGHSGRFWSVNPTNGVTKLLANLNEPGQIEWGGIDTSQGNLRVVESGTGSLYYFNFLTASASSPAVLVGTQTSTVTGLTIVKSGPDIIVQWPATWTNLILQQNSNLVTTNWTPTDTNRISNDGTKASLVLPSPSGNLFFRLSPL